MYSDSMIVASPTRSIFNATRGDHVGMSHLVSIIGAGQH
jgi:hypothetical protein